jgi:hypothetical protein
LQNANKTPFQKFAHPPVVFTVALELGENNMGRIIVALEFVARNPNSFEALKVLILIKS